MSDKSPYQAIRDKFARQECVVLDGANATELQARGARDLRLSDSDHWGFEALQNMAQTVADVHKSYLAAGCDIITTNTYGILDAPSAGKAVVQQGSPAFHWMELARKAVSLARDAIADNADGEQRAVALSIGGDVVTDDHLRTVKLLLRAIHDAPPDLVIVETLSMMHSNHTRKAVELILAAGLPVWMSFRRCREGVCGIHGQLYGGPEGDYFGRLAAELEELGVGAILINCLPAQRVSGTLPWLAEFTDLPLGAYPNLGRYIDPAWKFDENTTPDEFADMGLIWRAEGASILGGCCGVRPAHIKALARAVADTRPNAPIGRPPVSVSPAPSVSAWTDDQQRVIFPLAMPQLVCDPDVFVPTQGSYLVWKHLYNERVGANQRCLDVGCGAGLLTVQLALNGATHVTAMDVDKAAVANTLTNAFRNGVSEQVGGEVADLYTLAPTTRYDVVVASLYQMPTDPRGDLSGHRPVDYWGRNLLDHLITLLPDLLADNGKAYIMQISLLSQIETERQLRAAGFRTRVVDYNPYQFGPVFLENLQQIERVEQASDGYHFTFGDSQVMVMYLIEAERA